MKDAYSNRPFAEEVPVLLEERGLSLRALARAAGVNATYLSKAIRGVDYKKPSRRLCERVATALALPRDYFPEFRESVVVSHVRSDPALRDQIYRELKARGG